ncbi:hypothetical protein GCM10022219_19550 [Microbacterium oryzae]
METVRDARVHHEVVDPAEPLGGGIGGRLEPGGIAHVDLEDLGGATDRAHLRGHGGEVGARRGRIGRVIDRPGASEVDERDIRSFAGEPKRVAATLPTTRARHERDPAAEAVTHYATIGVELASRRPFEASRPSALRYASACTVWFGLYPP